MKRLWCRTPIVTPKSLVKMDPQRNDTPDGKKRAKPEESSLTTEEKSLVGGMAAPLTMGMSTSLSSAVGRDKAMSKSVAPLSEKDVTLPHC